MKRGIPAVVIVLVALSGALAWQQAQRARELDRQVVSLSAELREKEFDAREQRELVARLKAENEGYNKEASALRERLVQQTESLPSAAVEAPQSAPSANAKKAKMSDFLNGMMNDPKMKEMMRQQPAVMLKQMYGDFVKQRRLSPQQADQFFELLTQKQTGTMEEGMRLLGGENKEAAKGEPQPQPTPDQRAEADRQLQMLLGGAGYAAYQDYEKTLSERTTLNEMRQQLALNGAPLQDEQAKTLLQVMLEERDTIQSATDDIEKWKAVRSGTSEAFLQAQADFDQRVRNRAASILKPEQFSALEAYQKQQLEMQRLGLEMARTMMGDDEDGVHTTTVIMPSPRR